MNILIDIIKNFDAENAVHRVEQFEMCRVGIKIAFGPFIGFVIDRYSAKLRFNLKILKLIFFDFLNIFEHI